jgi:hypothetical protein
MTESTAPYYHWNSRSDSLVPPYNACSPNLVSLQDYYRRRWGAVSLGCHNQRPVTGGSSLSSHAWGAACDPRFPDRAVTLLAMAWTISFSKELGINTIHDYITQRMWKPTQGWVPASIGSVGGQWIHVETTPAMFGDGRPVEDKLPGSGQGGGEEPMTPEDKGYLESKFAAVAPATADPSIEGWPTFQTGQAVGDTRVIVQQMQTTVASLSADIAALKTVSEQILAAIQGAEFPVTGTVHIGNE